MGVSTPRHHFSSPLSRSLLAKRIVTFRALRPHPPRPPPLPHLPSFPCRSDHRRRRRRRLLLPVTAAGAQSCREGGRGREKNERGAAVRLLGWGVGAERGGAAVQRDELRRDDQGPAELRGARAARHGVPPVAMAPARVRAPAVRPGRVPPPRPRPPRRLRGRLPGPEPVRVPRLPAQLAVPGPARARRRRQRRGRRRAPQVQALGVPVPRRHGVRLLVPVPGERHREGQGGGVGAGSQPVLPRPARRAVGGGASRHRRGGAVRWPLVPAPGHVLRPRRRGRVPPLPGAQPHRDGLLRRVPPRRPRRAPRGRPPQRPATAAGPPPEAGRGDDVLAGALRGGVGQPDRVRAHGAVRARGAGDGVHGRRDAPRRGRGDRGGGRGRQGARGGRHGGGAAGDADGRAARGRAPGRVHAPVPVRRRRVPSDRVCLPGPIDTWNEILLQVVKRWADGDGADASSSSP